MPDSFAEKAELIQAILAKEGLGFKPGMSTNERERLDALRVKLAVERGWDKLSLDELQRILEKS